MNTRATSRRSAIWLATITAAASALLTAAPAQAETTVEREEVTYGFFYDNVVLGDGQPPYLVIAGGTLEEFCEEGDVETAAPGTAELQVKLTGEPPADGATQEERFVTRGTMEVYGNEGMGAPDFLAFHCAIWAESGELPEPYAMGTGLVKAGTDVSWADGEVHAKTWNTARGQLHTADGELLVVWAEARLTLAPEFSLEHVGFEFRNR